ncbi:hypothetical protein M569_00352, partial [Genlisea aurea]
AMAVPSAVRLRREEFRRTKHDAAFSPWKILVGDSDWKDHSRGKEGTERYRTQNLPNWTSCPGVYELGIATTPSGDQDPRKLDADSVIPVYLGQADNLRTRLQSYGRNGAHLETPSLNDDTFPPEKGLKLFTAIFSRALPIAYRCAPMKSKTEAERTEKQLLETFDYAWNKGSNGARRVDDIYRKLDHRTEATRFSVLADRLFGFFVNRKKVGIEIGAPDRGKKTWKVFGIKRVQQQVQDHDDHDHHHDRDVCCGVAIGGGSVCKAPPVEGRKRCALHKGMRVNGGAGGGAGGGGERCGLLLEDGTCCEKMAVPRNKRCLEHKGRR